MPGMELSGRVSRERRGSNSDKAAGRVNKINGTTVRMVNPKSHLRNAGAKQSETNANLVNREYLPQIAASNGES